MSEDYEFGVELKKSIFTVEPNKREDLLKLIFKNYVAKLLIVLKEKTGVVNDLEAEMLTEVRGNLIREFRAAPLDNSQRSVKFYEGLFDEAIKGILSEAAANHEGKDSVKLDTRREVKLNEGAFTQSASGIYIPNGIQIPKI